MKKEDNKKTFFNLAVILILIIFGYFFLRDNFGMNIQNLDFTFGENPLIKLISVIMIGFVGFLIIKSFIKMISKNI